MYVVFDHVYPHFYTFLDEKLFFSIFFKLYYSYFLVWIIWISPISGWCRQSRPLLFRSVFERCCITISLGGSIVKMKRRGKGGIGGGEYSLSPLRGSHRGWKLPPDKWASAEVGDRSQWRHASEDRWDSFRRGESGSEGKVDNFRLWQTQNPKKNYCLHKFVTESFSPENVPFPFSTNKCENVQNGLRQISGYKGERQVSKHRGFPGRWFPWGGR